MISRVAIVPHPPLLVPELAGGAVEETASLREACLAAAKALSSVALDWLAVGFGALKDPGRPGEPSRPIEPESRGSFLGYGVDVGSTLSEIAPEMSVALPLSALIAGWLRERAGAASVQVRVLDSASSIKDCVELGRYLDDGDRSGLLVLGDGSNRHGPRAPGGHDPRAAGFDAGVSDALERADTGALAGLDPVLSAELGAGGRAPWQVLVGLGPSASWRPELRYSAAPFGVGYHVAVWERR